MHHPPLPSHIPLFDILELRDQGRLAEVLAGTDVRAILAGPPALLHERHVRRHPGERRGGHLLHDGPRAPAAEVNGMDAGQSFHLVHVYDDTITHAVVPVVDAQTGEYFSADVGRADGGAHAGRAARGVLAQARQMRFGEAT